MRVDIWSDVICPWCYVGKARFEKALSSFAHRDEVEVVYHSFELDPSSPRGQREIQPGDAQQEVRQVAGRGTRAGRPGRHPGAGRGARLRLGAPGRQHLRHPPGAPPRPGPGACSARCSARSTRPTSRRRGTSSTATCSPRSRPAPGSTPAEVGEVFDGDAYADEVRQDELQARQIGINGVPFFVFDMALGASGAQPTELFTSALNQAWDAGLSVDRRSRAGKRVTRHDR